MKRSVVIQASLAVVGVLLFAVGLSVARMQFSGSHATNLLGVLQEPEQPEEDNTVERNKSVADYALPMYCCPAAHSGESCRLFDSIDRRKCGVEDAGGGFEPGEEFQPTEAGFEACADACRPQ